MIFFHLTLLYCNTSNLENVNISKEESFIDTLVFKTIKDILDKKHDFIDREFFLDILDKNQEKEMITDYIFETLENMHDIISDNSKELILHLMSFEMNDCILSRKFKYKNSLLSNSIHSISKFSSKFGQMFSDPKYDNPSFNLLFKLYSKFNSKFNVSTYEKVYKYFNDKSKSNVRKVIKAEKFIDKYLILDLLFMSEFFCQLSKDKKLNNLYDELPYYENSSKIFKFMNSKEPSIFLFFSGQVKIIDKLQQIYISSKFPTSLDDLVSFFESFHLYPWPKTNTINNFCNEFKKYLNKQIYFDNKDTDLLLNQIHLFSLTYKCEILIKMTKIGENSNKIEIQDIEKFFYLNLKLKSLKEKLDSSEEMLKLINNNIVEDKLHEFTTVVDLKNYTFKKPSENCEGKLSVCLRLSCGHFIGRELLGEYFYYLEGKCNLCNTKTTVANYFEAIVYEDNSY